MARVAPQLGERSHASRARRRTVDEDAVLRGEEALRVPQSPCAPGPPWRKFSCRRAICVPRAARAARRASRRLGEHLLVRRGLPSSWPSGARRVEYLVYPPANYTQPNARSLHIYTHTHAPHYFDLPFTPGTRPEKIRIQKWYTIYKDHITLADYEIHDGMGLELYYN